jgi:hypothetical protein
MNETPLTLKEPHTLMGYSLEVALSLKQKDSIIKKIAILSFTSDSLNIFTTNNIFKTYSYGYSRKFPSESKYIN